jgi:hypothetical protein
MPCVGDDQLIQAVIEQRTVRQIGQRIELCLVLQLAQIKRALGDVLDHANDKGGAARFALYRRQRALAPEGVAIGSPSLELQDT